MTRRLLLSAAVLCFAASALAAQGPRRVTLDDALRLSAQNSPTMVQARQDIRVAQWGQRTALGAFLPSLSSSASGSTSGAQRIDATTGRPVTTGSLINESYGLSANLDLFTGFRRGANRRVAQATLSLREASRLRQEYAVALSTKQAFFTALATAELVAVAETRLRRAGEQMNLVSEKLRLGATTRSDSLRSRVEYGNAQLTLIQARANERNAQATLARAIGSDVLVAPVPDTTLEIRLGPLDTALLRREALAAAPTVQEAQASAVSTRASLAATRAAYLPTISSSGSLSWARADSVLWGAKPLTNSWSVRVSVNYPLFNGFVRESNLATADANVTSADARLRDARLLLDANLTQALAGLEAAAAKIDIARTSVAAAEEDLRMQRERYRLGTSTIVEVLTTQVSADQAQVDLVTARYDYLVARAQLEAYVGHPL
jgi:outer membrane protein